MPEFRECKFEDGREHITKWSGIFEGESGVNREAFIAKVCMLLTFFLSIFSTSTA
jgi:hypothetical protein